MNAQPADDFNAIINNGYNTHPEPPTPAPAGPAPYGPNPQVKTGITPRGKAAIAVAATVIAGGSLLGWQHYATQDNANQLKAQELTLQQQQLELEKLRELNRQATEQDKEAAADNKAAQKQIDACVATNKDLVGKIMGVDYESVRSDCEAQYGTDNDRMQATASSDDGGGINSNFVLVGAGAAALILLVGMRRTGRRNDAPTSGHHCH